MPETFDALAHEIAHAIEIAGVAVILLGAVIATLVFLWRAFATREYEGAYHRYRSHLGRGILLGLELLVAADIIGTVAMEPNFESLGVLALIIVIRTFLSFSLEVEINGHWPWQASSKGGFTQRDER